MVAVALIMPPRSRVASGADLAGSEPAQWWQCAGKCVNFAGHHYGDAVQEISDQMKRILVGGVLLLSGASGALAQQSSDEWEWSFAPYLWAAGLSGDVRVGPVESEFDFDFGDIADVLAGGALFHVETHKDHVGFFGDFIYLSLDPDSKPLPSGGGIDVDVDTTIIELGYVLKTRESGNRSGVEFGIRNWDFDTRIRNATLGTFDRSTDWTDVFVGYRGASDLGANWSSVSRINFGGGGSDFSLGADITFLRELQGGNSFAAGVKALTVDEEDRGVVPYEIATDFAGITIGYVFR
jgi:hypothetical protein